MVNDRILLIQMTGNTSANGGNFEFSRVVAVSGNNITLSGMTRTYSPTAEKVQLVWVPYDPEGITIVANILAKKWDGSTGRIGAVLTPGTLTMNDSILADEAGFRYVDSTNTINDSNAWYDGGSGIDNVQNVVAG